MTTNAVAALELFGTRTDNCIRAAVALEEAGLPYTARTVNLPRGEHRSDAFLSLNPSGKVPVLVAHRDDVPPLVLSQSTAIMLYAARVGQPDLLPQDESATSTRAMERFFYMVTDVVAPSHASRFATWNGYEKVGTLHMQRSIAAFSFCEQFVTDSTFLAGESITLADIVAVTFAMFNEEHIDWKRLPALRAWFERVANRSAVQRGIRAFN